MPDEKYPPFQNRYRILGTLTTCSPLHIGDGDVLKQPTGGRHSALQASTETAVQIASVATDAQGRPYLPGKGIKGALRSWLGRATTIPYAQFSELFGSEHPNEPNAVGGKVEFHDAFVLSESLPTSSSRPYYDPVRGTDVSASVTIDRKSRTASEHKLFHEEFVLPGVQFQVCLTAQNLEEEDVRCLLLVLESFNSRQVTLGANTQQGWGHLDFQLTGIERLTKADVQAWLEQDDPKAGYAALTTVPDKEIKAIRDSLSQWKVGRLREVPQLALDVELHFQGPFLVNDPGQTQKPSGLSEEEKRKLGKADHAPLLDAQGRCRLPSRSVRGAIRSHAEWITRTFSAQAAGDLDDPENTGLAAVHTHAQVQELCPIGRLFGTTGWASPLEISEFRSEKSYEIAHLPWQDFVAIDRFTGGAAPGYKFDAQYVDRPVLKGTISLKLERTEPWALGCLALVFRDLLAGRLSFGFGNNKGYGACTAKVTDWHVPLWNSLEHLEDSSAWKSSLTEANLANTPAWRGLPHLKPYQCSDVSELRQFLEVCVAAFHQELMDHQPAA